MKATEFLQAAIDTQAERGKQYDSPEGERSMGRTVQAFNAITGRDLTEAEGWLLLQVLKDVRQWSAKGYHHDSALDGVAYASLKAEALSAGEAEVLPGLPEGWIDIRQVRPTPAVGKVLDLLMVNNTVRTVSYEPDMLFPDVAAWRFSHDGWIEHDGRGCPLAAGTRVEVRYRVPRSTDRKQVFETKASTLWSWPDARPNYNPDNDIVAYRLA